MLRVVRVQRSFLSVRRVLALLASIVRFGYVWSINPFISFSYAFSFKSCCWNIVPTTLVQHYSRLGRQFLNWSRPGRYCTHVFDFCLACYATHPTVRSHPQRHRCRRQGCRGKSAPPKVLIWWKFGQNPLESGQNSWKNGKNLWKPSQNPWKSVQTSENMSKNGPQNDMKSLAFFGSHFSL